MPSPATADRNLITASGLAAVEFTYEVLRYLGPLTPAGLEAWKMLFTTKESGYFFELMREAGY